MSDDKTTNQEPTEGSGQSHENGQPNKRIVREFGLSSFAVDNATSIFVVVLLITIMGALAYIGMPKENFPEIKLPSVYVGVAYPGNSPLDMENLIARPIEKEINTIKGVDKINTTCIQDYATIIAEFDLDVDVDKAVQEVKDAVDKAKPDLPNDLPNEPNIFEIDFSEIPVMNINISGVDNLDQLNDYAEYLQEEIEKLGEISSVDIRGVPEKEVSINVDVHQLEARKINFNDIEEAIGRENVTISGGDVLAGGMRRNLRVVGEFDRVDQMGDIVVSNENNSIVYLRDVADVSFGYADRESYARTDLMPVVTCDVKKRSGENLLNAAAKIKEIVKDAEENRFPPEIEIAILNDQSRNTQMMVDNLENSIIAGIILVVLVLQFFLGFRNAMFVGVAIPLSMLCGFMILGISGVTLNVMVLFSLILALGMLVDNGIVVVENIYRLMVEEGYPARRAAKEGVGEVAWPIISSTATTLAAFVPLLFWKDIMGEFMKFLPITLMIVLASSLFVALIVNPVLTAVFMKPEGEGRKPRYWLIVLAAVVLGILSFVCYYKGFASNQASTRMLGGLFGTAAILLLLNAFVLAPLSRLFQSYALPFLESVYRATLRFALRGIMPVVFFLGTIALLFLSVYILLNAGIKMELFPVNEPNSVYVYIEEPIGTDIEKTNAFTEEVERVVMETIKPYKGVVESVLGQVGTGTGDPNGPQQQGASPNKSRITVAFVEFEKRRNTSTTEILKEIRKAVGGYPGVEIKVDKDQMGPPAGAAINIEVIGEDFGALVGLSEEVKRYIEEQNIAGIEHLKLDMETSKPELLVKVDREKARRFGTSTAHIASTIRTAVFGKEVSKYKEGEDDYPIQLRFNESSRYDLPTILNQKLTFRNNRGQQMQIPISAVADVEYSTTYGSVRRIDMDRVVSISSNVLEGYNGNEVVQHIQKSLAGYDLPEGYEIKFTGETEEQQESMAFLSRAMMIAVFLIFLIIVTQFNSVAMPVIIVFSVVFSTIGVFLGYVAMQMDFIIIMTGIGIISLAGVVVNNAIVLIDYINLVRLRQRNQLSLRDDESQTKGQLVNAIVEAGSKRLRPVLLTAITTVLGLIPLATGMNINFFSLLSDFDPNIYFGGDNAIFWGPMAWTVIFGLTFATFLTLVIVPVMYFMVDRTSAFVLGGGISGRRKKERKFTPPPPPEIVTEEESETVAEREENENEEDGEE